MLTLLFLEERDWPRPCKLRATTLPRTVHPHNQARDAFEHGRVISRFAVPSGDLPGRAFVVVRPWHRQPVRPEGQTPRSCQATRGIDPRIASPRNAPHGRDRSACHCREGRCWRSPVKYHFVSFHLSPFFYPTLPVLSEGWHVKNATRAAGVR